MLPIRPLRPLVSIASAALLLGCAASEPKQGLMKAEDLLGSVERIYVECELSNSRARTALGSLQSLVAADFEGDGTEAYLTLVEEVEHSFVQADVLRETIAPLRQNSVAYFERWQASLGTITSETLRQRSEARLDQARTRCDAILASVEPAQQAYDALNAGMRDHVTFLGNDLSGAAFAELEADVALLAELAGELDMRLDACLTASQDYLRSAALPDRVDVTAGEVEGARR